MFFFSTATVKGVDMTGLSISKGSAEIQFGLVGNINEDFGGLQAGLYSEYKDSKGLLQFGIINRSTTSGGLQIGILNIMDN